MRTSQQPPALRSNGVRLFVTVCRLDSPPPSPQPSPLWFHSVFSRPPHATNYLSENCITG